MFSDSVARPLVAILVFSASVLLAAVVAPVTAQDRSGDIVLAARESSEVAFLRGVEERVMPVPLVPGVAQFESLPDYYWNANLALRYRLNEASRAYSSGSPRPFRELTVVAGPAGVGKTFIKQGVYEEWVPADQVWKFDVRELLGELAEQGLAEFKPDIAYGDHVVNRLLSMTIDGRTEFARQLALSEASFVVVDSIDEIHPDDYYFVLNELEQMALHGEREFIHVVVLGRPLAFRDYWRQRRLAGLPQGLRGFVLQPPDFRTLGDLQVSSWNHDRWKYGLSRTLADGESFPLSFPDFAGWCDQDFACTGEYADVTFKAEWTNPTKERDELDQSVQQHRIFASVLPNLAGNSIAREILADNVERGEPYQQRAFMDEFFARWLERDTKSDDRPSRIKPEYLDVYLRLLEAVAAKYVNEHRVNPRGYFDVVDDDRVVVEVGDESVSVRVARLLNRSGLVTLDPLLPVAERYRFEPIWLHRLLLEMHLERTANELN